ncbi:hypothetical protein TNCV_239591 [Trichonephila clavipes]|nr:hypothetical protein TNCV_239591 [Trichonephila clavipes]
MGVCKCIVPLRHRGTLNSRRAASPLVWLVEGVERWETPDHPQVSSLKIEVDTSQIELSPVFREYPHQPQDTSRERHEDPQRWNKNLPEIRNYPDTKLTPDRLFPCLAILAILQ